MLNCLIIFLISIFSISNAWGVGINNFEKENNLKLIDDRGSKNIGNNDKIKGKSGKNLKEKKMYYSGENDYKLINNRTVFDMQDEVASVNEKNNQKGNTKNNKDKENGKNGDKVESTDNQSLENNKSENMEGSDEEENQNNNSDLSDGDDTQGSGSNGDSFQDNSNNNFGNTPIYANQKNYIYVKNGIVKIKDEKLENRCKYFEGGDSFFETIDINESQKVENGLIDCTGRSKDTKIMVKDFGEYNYSNEYFQNGANIIGASRKKHKELIEEYIADNDYEVIDTNEGLKKRKRSMEKTSAPWSKYNDKIKYGLADDGRPAYLYWISKE